MDNKKIVGKHSYTWGQIKHAIQKLTVGARTRVILSENHGLIKQCFTCIGKAKDLAVEYSFSEKKDVPLGIYEGGGKYTMSKENIAKACMNEILRENGIGSSEPSQYGYQSLQGPDRIPVDDEDFFFSFEIIEK